ncbi:MAG TPA: hypothetical protein VFD59_02070 [Nocardioidaceae bacterium]|nr:hypothetical protein [Nocardioidaceae bacterium]
MSAEGVGLADFSEQVIGRYLTDRRAAGHVQYLSVKALRPLLNYLEPLGVLPAVEPVPLDPVEELLGRYRDYLLGERGLGPDTARGYVDWMRVFVRTRVRGGEIVDWAGLSVADVNRYVLATCPGRATGPAKLIVTSLRSLLGWLHLTGQLSTPLADAVPSVAG